MLKQMEDLRVKISQLRNAKVTGGMASKLSKIRVVRKSIALVLAVINQTQKENLRKFYKGKKYKLLDLRPKKRPWESPLKHLASSQASSSAFLVQYQVPLVLTPGHKEAIQGPRIQIYLVTQPVAPAYQIQDFKAHGSMGKKNPSNVLEKGGHQLEQGP
ncbi:hypothetical protein CB1_000582004 [Camelus ferus]|nr:hypothetical protein CB1_000582004 [Camelus ferus]